MYPFVYTIHKDNSPTDIGWDSNTTHMKQISLCHDYLMIKTVNRNSLLRNIKQ